MIKPLALFPLPTEPSSPISAEVPVTVKKYPASSSESKLSPVLINTSTSRLVYLGASFSASSFNTAQAALYSSGFLTYLSTIPQQIVKVILSFSLNPITLISLVNSLELNNSSVAKTKDSVSDKGAKPTPKEVSLEEGIALSLSNTLTRSPEPLPILHSITVSNSTSKLTMFSFNQSLAALIATLSRGK